MQYLGLEFSVGSLRIFFPLAVIPTKPAECPVAKAVFTLSIMLLMSWAHFTGVGKEDQGQVHDILWGYADGLGG